MQEKGGGTCMGSTTIHHSIMSILMVKVRLGIAVWGP